MSVYDYRQNELETLFDYRSQELSTAYNYKANIVFEVGGESKLARKSVHDSPTQAAIYAYDKTIADYNNSSTVFALFTDNHDNIKANSNSFIPIIGSIADWQKLWLIDLGDTTSYLGEDNVNNNIADPSHVAITNQVTAANIPSNRTILVWGNHDIIVRRASGSGEYGLVDKSYLLNTYFGNAHATHYWSSDFVVVDAHSNIKYVAIGGWDITEQRGGYQISGQHMDKLIEMLSVVDSNDIVILSHCNPYDELKYGWETHDIDSIPAEQPFSEDYSVAGFDTITNVPSGHAIDALLDARNDHTSGTILDSDGASHSYDFTNCNGRILCCLHGHMHADSCAYTMQDLILVYGFDYYLGGAWYLCAIDKTLNAMKLRKIDGSTVYEYQLPLRDVIN